MARMDDKESGRISTLIIAREVRIRDRRSSYVGEMGIKNAREQQVIAREAWTRDILLVTTSLVIS